MRGQTELRVKDLLAEGFANQAIADKLNISVRTVKFHIESLMRQRGLYGHGDSRRLIVILVREALDRPAPQPEKLRLKWVPDADTVAQR
jgi:DNA-binding NarL/FixJ family response regulator